jgi:hypothetical protein
MEAGPRVTTVALMIMIRKKLKDKILNVVVEWLTFLLCIEEDPGSKLSLKTSYRD